MARHRPKATFAVLCCLLPACARPCEPPLHYRIGTIDTRFGISEGQLLSALHGAEALWEDSAGVELFRYATDGALVVNLVYDERQRTAQDNARRTYTIETSGNLADQARKELEAARARHEAAQQDYEIALAAHEARVADQNRAVAAWNARGSGPAAEYAALQKEDAAIQASAAAVEQTRVATNALAGRANSLSDRYNELATEVNASISAINTTAGREFKQGRYTSDSAGSRIDVFEYTDRNDLVHVLAHELGHALGLEHNDDPASILFGKSSSHTLKLSDEDAKALREKCRLPVPSH